MVTFSKKIKPNIKTFTIFSSYHGIKMYKNKECIIKGKNKNDEMINNEISSGLKKLSNNNELS